MAFDYEHTHINWGKIIRITFLCIVAGVWLLRVVVSYRENRAYQQKDALENHSRYYDEFAALFNENMAEQGIGIQGGPPWDTASGYAKSVSCEITLPDGSLAPCYVELWGPTENSHIQQLHIRFAKEQAPYMEPVLRGIWEIFIPQYERENPDDYQAKLTACKNSFATASFKEYNDAVPLGSFALVKENQDTIIVQYRITYSAFTDILHIY